MSTYEPRDPEPTASAGDAPPVEEESLPADPEAYDAPRAVQARARGLAAPYIAGGEDPDMARARREERRNLRILIAMVVVIVLSGFVLGALQKLLEGAAGDASAGPPSAAVTSAPAGTSEPTSSLATGGPIATAAPGASPVPGAFEGGVPTALDGIEVVHGTALLAAAASVSDDTVFLVGGWFHAVEPASFCSIELGPPALWTCPGIPLYVGPSAALGVNLAHGSQGPQAAHLASEAYRPVVLRAHAHDPRCPTDSASCPNRLVLDEIAWLGESLPGVPTKPEESPPPAGFTRGDALAKARRQIRSTFELTSVTVVRQSESAPKAGAVTEDPWTWYFRFDEPGTGLKAWVVLDYMTGERLSTLVQTG